MQVINKHIRIGLALNRRQKYTEATNIFYSQRHFQESVWVYEDEEKKQAWNWLGSDEMNDNFRTLSMRLDADYGYASPNMVTLLCDPKHAEYISNLSLFRVVLCASVGFV